jgi:hypothetical protein
MSAAAQNNPEAKRGRHGESFTLIDPYPPVAAFGSANLSWVFVSKSLAS